MLRFYPALSVLACAYRHGIAHKRLQTQKCKARSQLLKSCMNDLVCIFDCFIRHAFKVLVNAYTHICMTARSVVIMSRQLHESPRPCVDSPFKSMYTGPCNQAYRVHAEGTPVGNNILNTSADCCRLWHIYSNSFESGDTHICSILLATSVGNCEYFERRRSVATEATNSTLAGETKPANLSRKQSPQKQAIMNMLERSTIKEKIVNKIVAYDNDHQIGSLDLH